MKKEYDRQFGDWFPGFGRQSEKFSPISAFHKELKERIWTKTELNSPKLAQEIHTMQRNN